MSRLALVTGGAGGIGRVLARRLGEEGYRVVVADVDVEAARAVAAETGGTPLALDVSRSAEWDRAAPSLDGLELACLNAGVLTGAAPLADLTDDAYRRAVAVTVDGVVLACARSRRCSSARGGRIVVTASLAGLVGMESDPVYSLTKHAVVGFVRSVAAQLEALGVTIAMVNPGIADTPMLDGAMREAIEAAGFPLIRAEDVAEAILLAARQARPGEALVVQPGREPVSFRFPNVPGPRVAGAEGAVPPPLPG